MIALSNDKETFGKRKPQYEETKMKLSLTARLDRWYDYKFGNITRFLCHPNDMAEAQAKGFVHRGLPIEFLTH